MNIELKNIVIEIIEILNAEFGGFIPECGGNIDSICADRCKQYLYCKRRKKTSDKLGALLEKLKGEKWKNIKEVKNERKG